ncbi:heme-dependent oxidative N-demethylase family protein [Martelella sp. AMO21009]
MATEHLRLIPYGRAYKPFSIGLSALDPDKWLEPGDDLGRYLAEKERLLAVRREEIFRTEDDSLAASREALALIAGHLETRHAGLYRRDGNRLRFLDRAVALDDPAVPPLMTAGMLIEDDLAILMKREDRWHLAAGFIAFPSSWSLAEKAGRPMEEVHADVPGFSAGTRNAALVARIFDNLKPGLPAERFNWSFKGANALAMPVSKHLPEDPFRPIRPIAANFMRVERQTLTRLPQTGAILFTIRIYMDPVEAILRHPERKTIATAMIGQLHGLSAEERGYKGMMDADIDALIAWLEALLR